jgi:hypothetical protein
MAAPTSLHHRVGQADGGADEKAPLAEDDCCDRHAAEERPRAVVLDRPRHNPAVLDSLRRRRLLTAAKRVLACTKPFRLHPLGRMRCPPVPHVPGAQDEQHDGRRRARVPESEEHECQRQQRERDASRPERGESTPKIGRSIRRGIPLRPFAYTAGCDRPGFSEDENGKSCASDYRPPHARRTGAPQSQVRRALQSAA